MPARKSSESPSRPGEFELISRYFAPLSGAGSFNLTDDAALVAVTPGKALAVTQDALAAGVHFLADDDPATIARKALRMNLSDLAAKGATPTAFSLALGLHESWDEDWVSAFAAGLAVDCARYGVVLSGGDTFRAPGGPVISITAWGEIDAGSYRTRLGARPGDVLFVTGTIGDAALGLKVRLGDPAFRGLAGAQELLRRYLVPEPPVAFAPLIARFASAAMDVSDGFAGDLQKLADASNVGFEMAASAVPMSQPVREALAIEGGLATALTGGDDYQILFTVPAAKVEAFREAAAESPVAVSRLCIATDSPGQARLLDEHGAELQFDRKAYSHF